MRLAGCVMDGMAMMAMGAGGEDSMETEDHGGRAVRGSPGFRGKDGASPIRHIRVDRDGAWEEEGSAASEALATGYTLGRLLGRGAFGSVYHATAPDGTAVAIKKVSMVGVSSAAGM
jgi:serine/threonine protein kinase